MPIRFRCTKCSRLLGISRRKAGQETICPQCGAQILVPPLDDDVTERLDAPPVRIPVPEPAAPAPAPVVAAPRPEPLPPDPPPREPRPRPAAKKPLSSETPLFEQMDLDEILGVKPKPAAPPADGRNGARRAVSGVDARSLGDGGDPRPVILSPRRATLLVVAVVVLLAFAFAAGYLIAPSVSG
jgi:DNA-directed RNA polymerase subunit RPC12/RpoP